MLTKRLIACFDVIAGRVTKAQQFQDNIDVAPAEELADRLYDDQIDEIVFYDITASAEKRKIDLDTVRRVAHHVFVPFTVGGGIRSLDDMFEVLKAGAEKISIDSMAVRNPEIIREGAEAFGRQCIVLSTQVKHVGVRDGLPSGYEVFIDGARLATGLDALDWVRRGEDLGAGEIVVNSIDRDGTASGYDLDITRAVADAVNVPVIASGGAGTVDAHRRRAHRGRRVGRHHQLDPLLTAVRAERRRPRAEGRPARARRADAPLPAAEPRSPEPARPGSVSQSSARGVGPQPLEVVVGAGLGEEHVDDDVAVVHEHPRRVAGGPRRCGDLRPRRRRAP